MTQPLLSIVTITYNEPDALDRTLASLAAQPAGQDWHIVVVDSSPDHNEPVLSSYRDRLPIEHVVTKPQGIYPAMNAGIAAATGTYLWFLNSGDTCEQLPPEATLKQHADEEAILAFAVQVADGSADHTVITPPQTLAQCVVGGMLVCHQGLIYHRAAFADGDVYDDTYEVAGDYDHLLRLSIQDWPYVPRSERIARYQTGGTSARRLRTYHQEIRSSVLANLDDQALRQLHLQLASYWVEAKATVFVRYGHTDWYRKLHQLKQQLSGRTPGSDKS